ncbi:unnamed protein product, partial [Ectocarpus fasciculatus]
MPVTRRATSKLVQARQRSSDDDDPTKGGVALGSMQASAESEVSRRLDLLMDKSFGDLQFLSDEFSKLEVVVAPAVPEGDDSGKAGTDTKLGRLRFFTTHVRRTMARMRDARSGRDPLSMSQLALLEEHIATSITPVKERLVNQLSSNSSGSSGSGSSNSSLETILSTGAAAAAGARTRSESTGSDRTRHEVSATEGD